MKLKKLISVMLIGACVCSMAACGSKKEEKKNSKESVDDVKMTEKDADAAKTAGAEDDGTQAQKENTDAENPKEASQSSESQSADGIDTVTDATYSSNGLIQAFQSAISQAK